jgi:hypothetical protein
MPSTGKISSERRDPATHNTLCDTSQRWPPLSHQKASLDRYGNRTGRRRAALKSWLSHSSFPYSVPSLFRPIFAVAVEKLAVPIRPQSKEDELW